MKALALTLMFMGALAFVCGLSFLALLVLPGIALYQRHALKRLTLLQAGALLFMLFCAAAGAKAIFLRFAI